MNDNFPGVLFAGILLGIFILGFAIRFIPKSDYNVFKDKAESIQLLITDCEKDLPRSQKCVLVAIPETMKENSK